MDNYNQPGLPLPPLLVALLEQNRWHHPGDDVIRKLIPFLREPVDFLKPERLRWSESQCFIADDPRLSPIFHEVRGSQQRTPVHLPWLDIEHALFIAENRVPGDDVGIALDYRTNMRDPRVVASDWWSGPGGCLWQEVAPTFSQFVQQLGLD
jgi:hypothetical protein